MKSRLYLDKTQRTLEKTDRTFNTATCVISSAKIAASKVGTTD